MIASVRAFAASARARPASVASCAALIRASSIAAAGSSSPSAADPMRTALRYCSAPCSASLAARRRSCAALSFSRASSMIGSACSGSLIAAWPRSVCTSESRRSAPERFSVISASIGCSAPRASSSPLRTAETSSSYVEPACRKLFSCASSSTVAVSSPDAWIDRTRAMRSSMPATTMPLSCDTRSRSIRSSRSASRRMRAASDFASRRCGSVPPALATSVARVRSSSAASAGAMSVWVISRASPASLVTVLPTASGLHAMRPARARALAVALAILPAPVSAGLGTWMPLQDGRVAPSSRAEARTNGRFMSCSGFWGRVREGTGRVPRGLSGRGRPARGPGRPGRRGAAPCRKWGSPGGAGTSRGSTRACPTSAAGWTR